MGFFCHPGAGEVLHCGMQILKCILLFLAANYANNLAAQGTISVKISNLRNDKGHCIVCLYNNERSFRDKNGTPVKCISVVPKDGMAEVAFANVLADTYAVMVIHDANDNGKFDTNFLGIPKEGYGASRNNLPFAAAPRFDANKFVVQDKLTVHLAIRLRNL
jgi:uncharacterized protein (DUF2141 family)